MELSRKITLWKILVFNHLFFYGVFSLINGGKPTDNTDTRIFRVHGQVIILANVILWFSLFIFFQVMVWISLIETVDWDTYSDV